MKSATKWSLGTLWLLASITALFIPIFVPSARGPASILDDVITLASAVIYVLSFPISLVGIPLLYVTQILIGIDPNSIGGKYLNSFLVFLLGLVQWFWIVPHLLRKPPRAQILDLPRKPDMQLSEAKPAAGFSFFDSELRTPLERVLRDDDTN